MLRVERLELREVRLPLREPFVTSMGAVQDRRILLLELTDTQGAHSWSECVALDAPHYTPETIDTAWLALSEWLAPRLLGQELDSARQVHDLLRPGIRGHEMARGALEMGCWALEAELRGVALARLLGGERETVATGISMGIEPTPEAQASKAVTAVAAGYRKIKLKIKPGFDIDHVAAVRKALGPDVAMMADANSAYTLADIEHLKRLDDFDLVMLEQPLPWDDLVDHAALQAQLRTPICLDESVCSLDHGRHMLQLDAGRVLNIKPGRVAGFQVSIALHDLCAAHDVPVWCGGMLESGIGRAHNVALASLPNFRLPGDLSPSARYWQQDIVTPEWTMQDGHVRVPFERPGLGVEVDRERVEYLTVRRQTLCS